MGESVKEGCDRPVWTLSDRIRPNVEAAPWVVEQVKLLEEVIEKQKIEAKASDETVAMLYERAGRFAEQADRLERERDAARAEVERLRAIVEVNDQRLADCWDQGKAEVERLRGALRPTGHNLKTCCCPDCCTLRQVTKERDEARAEVARLHIKLGEKR